ncbi:uncharacterized protein LOC133715095 [Rosa rugosa]|uniref:uncharacterized protein LOC133715095 n=1 Tax=Rosa rugosa TaxID=74645 RepID=UPI002B4100E3|nr:uncharacterized protein LOC133715095 [Rosa rugosa]XP_061997434.1 uncharacterized protein LOC133715095 [Rosa rugosa]XP_061997435.1 uncharacterized protein LOC133715095 [Rosa rugosa]
MRAGGRWLRSRSQGCVESGVGSARFWIWFRELIWLMNGLRVVVVRRCRVDARRRGAPRGRRSGAGRWHSMLAWWASALGPWERWWMGRASAFGLCCCFLISVCFVSSCCFVYFVVCSLWVVLRFLRVISPYTRCVGIVGLFARGCTLCALSALGRRRFTCVVKWLLPPSGRVRLHATGCRFQWQHDRKAGRSDIMLCCIRVTDQVIFPSCHCLEANRTVWSVFFASWCGLEYKCLVESSIDFFSGCTLDADCNMRFRLFVPPLVFVGFIYESLRAATPALVSKKKKKLDNSNTALLVSFPAISTDLFFSSYNALAQE